MTAITANAEATLATAQSSGLRNEKLHKAAGQFEAMMLQEILKPLADKSEESGTSSADGAEKSSPLDGFGIQAVAESLAHSGALGFAKQIEASLASRTPGVHLGK